MDLYFARHDGEAVTIEAFLACFAEAAGRDLGQFHRWYTQAGTPQIVAEGQHDPASKTYTLTVTQRTPPTPGQEAKQPLHIPLRVGLIGGNGEDMTLACDEARGDVLELTAPMQIFRFRNVAQRPVLSLNRGFSAPALLTTNATPEDELFAMAHDSDSFNRWQAAQSRGLALLTARYGGTVRPAALQAYSRALAQAATDPKLEQAFRGLLLTLPTEADMAAAIGREVSAPQVKATRDAVRTDLATLLLPELKALWAETAEAAHGYMSDAAGAGRRALRYAVLPLLLLADPAAGEDLARSDFTTTPHLTARMGVLQALVQATLPFRNEALAHFRDGAGNDPLLIDKWFMLQAQAGDGAAVQALLAHADFTYLVPNRVHALVSTFMAANPAAFHASDGTGYVAVADAVIASDRINPQLAARVATGFRSWRMFDASARRHAEAELGRILGQRHLSRDCYEIVSRIMQAP
jgi:aminopeptidase N